MVYPLSPAQKAMFSRSHQMSATCTLLRGSVNLGQQPVISASVSATYGTQGGRDASITVDSNLIRAGLFNPLSDEVVLRTGIKGELDMPIFTGRVDRVGEDSDGETEIILLSRAAELIRAKFEVPWTVAGGGQARSEIARVINAVNVDWGVDFTNANDALCPNGLVYEDGPGEACDALAKGASLIWQPDRAGSFVVYNNPYFVGPSLASNPAVILTAGVDGTLARVEAAKSRENVFNSVTVVVERVDNVNPIRITVRDGNPVSPTFWGGIFGKQNLVVKSQTPVGFAETQNLAIRILRQSLALQRSWTISVPNLPYLDPGDVFILNYQNEVFGLVAEQIEYSYNAQDPTIITARELLFQDVDIDLIT